MYTYILLQGANQLAEGSEGLLEVSDPGFIGGNADTSQAPILAIWSHDRTAEHTTSACASGYCLAVLIPSAAHLDRILISSQSAACITPRYMSCKTIGVLLLQSLSVTSVDESWLRSQGAHARPFNFAAGLQGWCCLFWELCPMP